MPRHNDRSRKAGFDVRRWDAPDGTEGVRWDAWNGAERMAGVAPTNDDAVAAIEHFFGVDGDD